MAVDSLTLLYIKNGILSVDFAIPAVIASSHAVNTFLLLVVVSNILAFDLSTWPLPDERIINLQ